MLELETTRNETLTAKIMQEIKRNCRKFSPAQVLRAMQLSKDMSVLGLSMSEVVFEKERLGSTRFFKNPEITIGLMEQFLIHGLLNKNLGELLESHIKLADFSSLSSQNISQFFLTHCIWFDQMKNQDSLPWTPREAK